MLLHKEVQQSIWDRLGQWRRQGAKEESLSPEHKFLGVYYRDFRLSQALLFATKKL